MMKNIWLLAMTVLVANLAIAGELDEASFDFFRTRTLSTDNVLYHVAWNCQGQNLKRVLIKRPRSPNCVVRNMLMLGSFGYQTEEIDETTFKKMFREGLHQIIAYFHDRSQDKATFELAYNQFPAFVVPSNLEDGATGVTFPFTITWEAVEADWIWIEIKVDGLTAGNSVSGDETSFELDKWLYMPGKVYTITFSAIKELPGGIGADNSIQSVTVLKFTSAEAQ